MEMLASDQAALALQLEEISLFENGGKGKHREGEPTDFLIAMGLLQESLEESLRICRDAAMARSMAIAVEAGEIATSETAAVEQQATQDRRITLNLDNGIAEPAGLPLREETDENHDLALESVEAVECHHDHDHSISHAGPSNQTPSYQLVEDEKATCCICLDTAEEKHVKLQCGDRYHIECLKGLFVRAAKDSSLFPPSCHRTLIPLDSVAPQMSTGELERYHEAEEEFSTVNRLYCSNPDCARFIKKVNIVADQGTCPHCGTVSCLHCKGPAHVNDCPVDESLQVTLALAKEEGWQRCNRCSAVIELKSGCHHITCVCGSHFCYLCRETWKTCECEQWDERMLLDRAEDIVDREALAPLAPRERQRRVENMQQELLEVHDCHHPGRFERIFSYSGGKVKRCEMCSTRHKKYLLRCRRCHVQVCEECRRHRI